jgi:hypothetical protein
VGAACGVGEAVVGDDGAVGKIGVGIPAVSGER